ncbi:MAG: DUF3179 domain-containing protein [Desulfomonile tiedjei]|uniref:DUF3179 domain-containing protein n=1 Tax=Desulfomonile tiedjei TaxID=2358 RepID=A0A9D6Z526_9BACT|nr:DUF3179 domain-containing protein [Desulfomonile tiedjei]
MRIHARIIPLLIAVCLGFYQENLLADFGSSHGQISRLTSGEKMLPAIDEIQGDRVHTVLPKDAIQAIDYPEFVTADRATFMKPTEPVVGVVHKGIAKAYSVWHLDRHEIVNDQFGEDLLAVTW